MPVSGPFLWKFAVGADFGIIARDAAPRGSVPGRSQGSEGMDDSGLRTGAAAAPACHLSQPCRSGRSVCVVPVRHRR